MANKRQQLPEGSTRLAPIVCIKEWKAKLENLDHSELFPYFKEFGLSPEAGGMSW